MDSDKPYLTGKFLVAMPSMPDPRFAKAVVLVCGHDEKGAMGLVINKPLLSLTFNDLLENVKIDSPKDFSQIRLHFGGPVEMGRGFVLHSTDYHHESTVKVTDEVALTATADILRAIVEGEGPKDLFLALGYAGWSGGQLDQEIIVNGWLVTDLDQTLLFKADVESRWEKALALVGIRPEMMSLEGGSA